MQTSYRTVLKKKNFFFLWASQVISQFGDRLTQMALIGLVYQLRPHSPLSLAKIMSIPVIAVFLISPVAGVYVDRWDKKKTLWISDLLRGLFILLIPVLAFYFKSILAVYVLIFLSFCMGRFFIPAKMAVIPDLVEEKQTFIANSLSSTTAMIAAVLGFGLGGVIVEKAGVKAAFIIDAATFFLSAFFIGLIRIKKEKSQFVPYDIIKIGQQVIKTARNSVIFEMKEGIKYLLEKEETRYAAKIFFLLFSCIGSLYVVLIIFIQDTFHSVTIDLGWLAVGGGAGLFVGSLLYGKVGRLLGIRKVINVSLVFFSAYLLFSVVLLYFYPVKLLAFLLFFLLGMVASPVVIGVNTLIHNESRNEFWGRIFSSLEVVIHLAFVVWMFGSSFLAEKFSAFTTIVVVCIIMFVFSCVLVYSKKGNTVGDCVQS